MAEKKSKNIERELSTIKPITSGGKNAVSFIRSVAVIGGGTTGIGLAQCVAQHGINVILIEKDSDALRQSMKSLNAEMDAEIARWGMTESDKRSVLSRIEGVVDIYRARHGDLVIEAITEDLERKKIMFNKLNSICKPDTIFISNTSTLSITEIAASSNRDDKCLGLHFLQPVPKIPIVSLIRGLKTSEETLAYVRKFAEEIDKHSIEVYESPGYVTTRLILVLINEAINILMEGVASPEDIDTAMKMGFSFPKGPLSLADEMGLDAIMIALESLFRELGDLKYRPCPLLRKLVRAGHYGKKSGKGFFEYK